MKARFTALGLTLALALSFAAAPSVRAADEPASLKIATVDMQKALQSVDAGKKAKGNLEKEVKSKQKMISDEEKAIKKLDEEFKKQSLVMNDEAKAKKVQEIQERAMKYQKMRAEYQMELQQKEAELIAPIIKNMKEVIKDVAAKKGYNFVLDKNEANVLYSQEKDDLTSELISAYNSKHKG